MNISSKRLSSNQRSDLYMFVNEKTEHRHLLNIIGRATDPNCQHCGTVIETIKHKFSECPRVASAWAYVQQKLSTTLGGWQRPSFDDLARPVLGGVSSVIKNNVLKMFVKFINYVNTNVNNRLDVAELDFILSLED